MEVKLSRFKEIYPSFQDWKTKVWDPMVAILAPKTPAYIDDTKMVYPPAMIFHLFDNKYSEFVCVNDDDRTNKLFINALLHTLPALYAKTQVLSPEAMDLLKPDTLFKNIEKRFNDDADNKYASTETTYSSTPSNDLDAGTFKTGRPKEKNIINRKDGSIRIKEITNYLSKLQELSNTNISGHVDDFINSIEFSSLFHLMTDEDERYIIVIETKFGDGSKTTTQSRALTDAEFEKLKHVGEAVFRDGANTNTQKRALRDDEFQKITQGGTFKDFSLTNTQKRAVKDEEFNKLDEGVITRVQYDHDQAAINDKLNNKQDDLTPPQLEVIKANPFTDDYKAQIEANTLKKSFTNDYKTKVDEALPKAEADAKYEPLTNFFTPTTSHQAGYIIADETGIKDVSIGTQVRLDLKGIDDMLADPTQLPAAGDRLFIGVAGAVRIPNAGGTAALKWETKTNATDINVKDNYKDKYFVLKKISNVEYDYVRLEDKTKDYQNDIDAINAKLVPLKIDNNKTAVGNSAGTNNQGGFATSLGYKAGTTNQGQETVAVGDSAGNSGQGEYSTAVGSFAGATNQGTYATAVGSNTGSSGQKEGGTAIGADAGYENQGTYATAIGSGAGNTGQGEYTVAVGADAGRTNQPAKSIIINASGVEKVPSASNEILLAAGSNVVKIDATGIYLNGQKQGGHWETIDQTTYDFTKPEKLRITYTHLDNTQTVLINADYNAKYDVLSFSKIFQTSTMFHTNQLEIINWISNKADKTILDYYIIKNWQSTDPTPYTITKFEIWKEE